jgi:hypothetical protein
LFGRPLGSKRGAFTGSLETHRTAGTLADHIAVSIRNRHQGIIKGGLDMNNPTHNIFSYSSFRTFCHFRLVPKNFSL